MRLSRTCRLAGASIALVALTVLAAGCTAGAEPPSDSSAGGASTSDATLPPSDAPTELEPVSKLLVFMVENHSFDAMREQMTWTFDLSEQYGYTTEYRALTHPSLPNYLAIAGGSLFDIEDDHPPDQNPVSGESVFGQALALGKTARVYAEGMPENCATEDGGDRYGVRHNPWAYFVDERDACLSHDVSMEPFAVDVSSGSLPEAGMVVPDTCHDGHDCDLSVVDDWMRAQVGLAMTGPDWESGRLAIVITADEDDNDAENHVLTTVAHPSLDGVVVDVPLDHYALTRLYDEVLGAPLLRNAESAPSMADAFGLTVGE